MGNRWLTHPLLRGLNMDRGEYVVAQRQVLDQKKFLFSLYQDFYRDLQASLPDGCSRVLELGSGAGRLETFMPGLLKSDVFFHPFIKLVLNGMRMPFADSALCAIALVDVFHHISEAGSFLREACRVLRVGGRLVMVEPWITPWSKLVFSRFHHEPLDWRSTAWKFASSGPVSGANQALPWIVFQRDRRIFEAEFPQLKILYIKPMMPFRYLLSGGLSSWIGLPGFFYGGVKKLERVFEKRINTCAMFALIAVEKLK